MKREKEATSRYDSTAGLPDLRTGSLAAFLQFMRLLAAMTGQMLNYSSIARDIGKSVDTVKSWVSVLRTSGIVFLLQPYYNNFNKRIVKTPKIYFLDTELASYLTGWYTSEQLQSQKNLWRKTCLPSKTNFEASHYGFLCVIRRESDC